MTPEENMRQVASTALFALSLTRQEEFDRTGRELREKSAAWEAEKKRLSDALSRTWSGLKKINRQLQALGCMPPDIISEEWLQVVQQQADAKMAGLSGGNEEKN